MDGLDITQQHMSGLIEEVNLPRWILFCFVLFHIYFEGLALNLAIQITLIGHQYPLLLTWFNFNPNMDK